MAFPATALRPGLNYGAFEDVQAGRQALYVVDETGIVVMSATNGSEISTGCPDGIFNMNYQVVGLKTADAHDCPCCTNAGVGFQEL